MRDTQITILELPEVSNDLKEYDINVSIQMISSL